LPKLLTIANSTVIIFDFLQVLELLCFKADMRKIMLTVFKHNPEAQKFFRSVMKFETDETNPYDDVYEQVFMFLLL